MTLSTQTDVRPASEPPELPRRTASKWIPIGALAFMAALGWIYLGMMIAGHLDHVGQAAPGHDGSLASLGPGMGWLDLLMPRAGLDPGLAALVDALCRPRFGHEPLAATMSEAAVAALMWVAMVLAMMLPTAAPMVAAAADVASAAARRGEPAASPAGVLAGYLAVWIAVALLAAALQVGLTRLALLDAAMATASPLFAGAVFVVAGTYQFSPLKDACVANCRLPVPFFAAARWQPTGAFRLGLRQGGFCVGCCWAMMLVMFAVGTMNVVWMAGLGFVMAMEKIAGTPRMSRVFGAMMILIGGATVLTAVVARWPA